MEREHWGTLERVPRTPQNFSRIIWLSGIGTVARFRAFLIFLSRWLQGSWRAAPVPAGASLFGCPPTLPLVLILPPIPPPPFPGGEGGEKFLVYFAGGSAPGTPALDRSRHLQSFPNRHPAEWRLFTTRVPAAPAGANAPFEAERTGFPQAMSVPRPFSPGDASGEAPCIRKLKISPFPVGEGGQGDRGQNQN